jgi:hypothetical protein
MWTHTDVDPRRTVQGCHSGGGTELANAPRGCDGHRTWSEAVPDRLSRQAGQSARLL